MQPLLQAQIEDAVRQALSRLDTPAQAVGQAINAVGAGVGSLGELQPDGSLPPRRREFLKDRLHEGLGRIIVAISLLDETRAAGLRAVEAFKAIDEIHRRIEMSAARLAEHDERPAYGLLAARVLPAILSGLGLAVASLAAGKTSDARRHLEVAGAHALSLVEEL